MQKAFIVQYSTGCYDEYCIQPIFVTTDETVAKKYVEKFNCIHNKWKEYFKQYETNKEGRVWIEDDIPYYIWNRWYAIHEINKCFYKEIELR